MNLRHKETIILWEEVNGKTCFDKQESIVELIELDIFSEETRQEPAVAVTVPSIDEFPTLNESSSTSQNAPQRGAWSNDVRGIHSADDFPALTAAGNAAVGQTRGIWREQPAIVSTSANQNTTSKKSAQSTNTITNGMSSMNVTEDFPALVGAVNRKIPAPVSMFSTWSTAKKSAKQTSKNF